MFSNIWPVMLSFRPGMMSSLTPVVPVQRKDVFSVTIIYRAIDFVTKVAGIVK